MHPGNLMWLNDLKKQYSEYFKNSKVLELGSHGTSVIRKLFDNCQYIGIDLINDPIANELNNVDLVINAKDTKFEKDQFDVLISFSMFEHDPGWQESLSHNIQWLKNGAMIFLSWGAEGNKPHNCGPFPFGIVTEKEFLDFAKTLPIKIIDNFFERRRYDSITAGAYDVVAKVVR